MSIDRAKLTENAQVHNSLTSNDNHPLSEQERQQLKIWNSTEDNFSLDLSTPELVARQAAANPGRLALSMGHQKLTYQELNQRANQLAHRLQELGVGPNTLVGFCMERSPEMVIGLLGILKAGGVYVPLDPSYPQDRLAFMLDNANVQVLVTQQKLIESLPPTGATPVYLDTATEQLSEYSSEDPTTPINVADLAYVIYTSGSTGRPKGVQITHTNLLNLVFWHQKAFGITAADRATQVTSPAFDATGWELWPNLTGGASIHLAGEEARVNPAVLRDWLVEQQITISFLPTALAEGALLQEWPAHTALRYLLTGADTLHHYPSANLPFQLSNNYGPTENTVVTTSGIIPPTEQTGQLPSIGRPISNVQVYILDEQLQQVPIGTPGELHIGGVGLAKGYLNRPDLTAEKFIANPFSNDPTARLYKTGDLARFLPDGQIAFMGRTDYQIKIRGYRIEPGEIITALNTNPAVQASQVIAREDAGSEKHLVAYIVPDADKEITVNALQQTLQELLPDYMIPSVFVRLDALPVTQNGKIDRNALPVPDADNTLTHEVAEAPSTPLETRIAEIVTGLLGLEEIDLDDNFFMLGGHSLLGTQVITRISDTFGIEISLRTIFESPTVRELAEVVEERILAKISAMSESEVEEILAQEHAVQE